MQVGVDVRPKVTIPKGPALETAHRAEKHRYIQKLCKLILTAHVGLKYKTPLYELLGNVVFSFQEQDKCRTRGTNEIKCLFLQSTPLEQKSLYLQLIFLFEYHWSFDLKEIKIACNENLLIHTLCFADSQGSFIAHPQKDQTSATRVSSNE